MSDRNTRDCDPRLQLLIPQFIDGCAAIDIITRPIVTWRSNAEQEAAKTKGLSKASGGESPHNCCDAEGNPASRAFDFGVFEPDGSYVSNGQDYRYAKAGAIGKSLGLAYGGDWAVFKDWDHLELANWRD